MSNKYNFEGVVELTNSAGFKTELNNKNLTSVATFEFPSVVPGTYTLSIDSPPSTSIFVDTINEATIGHGVDFPNIIHVDGIGEYTSGHGTEILDDLLVESAIGSVGAIWETGTIKAANIGEKVTSDGTTILNDLFVESAIGSTGALWETGTISTNLVQELSFEAGIDFPSTNRMDKIAEYTSGSGTTMSNDVIVNGTLKVNAIEGRSTSTDISLGNLAITSNTLSSSGVNQDININPTGTGNLVTTGSISAGKNLLLPISSATAGQIIQGGVKILHTTGTNNVFMGVGSGNFTTTSQGNSGVGMATHSAVTTGSYNVAIGDDSMKGNTIGNFNLAIGQNSLSNVALTGSENLAFGASALSGMTSGVRNVGVGNGALRLNTIGTGNVAIGYLAGDAYNGTESFNTTIGYQNSGVAGESNTTRIGYGSATSAYVYGISGANNGSSANIVGIAADSRLGTAPSLLTTTVPINTSSTYKINGTDILDSQNLYLPNGVATATLNNAGATQNCVFRLPNKPATTYTLATTSDITTKAYASYYATGNATTNISDVSYVGLVTPTLNATVTATNFTLGSGTVLTYTGTETITAKISVSVGLTLAVATNIVEINIFKNGGVLAANAVTMTFPFFYPLSIDILTPLATGETINIAVRSLSIATLASIGTRFFSYSISSI